MNVLGPFVAQHLVSVECDPDLWSELVWCHVELNEKGFVNAIKIKKKLTDKIERTICTPRLRIFDPALSLSQIYCLLFYKHKLYQFSFALSDSYGVRSLPVQQYNEKMHAWFPTTEIRRNITNHWVYVGTRNPHEIRFTSSSKSMVFDISETDYLKMQEELEPKKHRLLEEYQQWINKRNAQSKEELSWMQEREQIDFYRPDATNKLSYEQQMAICNSGFCLDWSVLKKYSTSKTAYCLDLIAVLTGGNSIELAKRLDEGASVLRGYLYPKQIDRSFASFNQGALSCVTIGDVRRYMVDLLHLELLKYKADVKNAVVNQFNASQIGEISSRLNQVNVGELQHKHMAYGLEDDAIAIFRLLTEPQHFDPTHSNWDEILRLCTVVENILKREIISAQVLSDLEVVFYASGRHDLFNQIKALKYTIRKTSIQWTLHLYRLTSHHSTEYGWGELVRQLNTVDDVHIALSSVSDSERRSFLTYCSEHKGLENLLKTPFDLKALSLSRDFSIIFRSLRVKKLLKLFRDAHSFQAFLEDLSSLNAQIILGFVNVKTAILIWCIEEMNRFDHTVADLFVYQQLSVNSPIEIHSVKDLMNSILFAIPDRNYLHKLIGNKNYKIMGQVVSGTSRRSPVEAQSNDSTIFYVMEQCLHWIYSVIASIFFWLMSCCFGSFESLGVLDERSQSMPMV